MTNCIINDLKFQKLPHIDWKIDTNLIQYTQAIDFMANRVEAIKNQEKSSMIWLLQHPKTYTAGTSANIARDCLDKEIEIIPTGRGGKLTYHGPGQQIIYAMLDLRIIGKDVHCFVRALEHWTAKILAEFGIIAQIREGRVGLWVDMNNGKEAKIAAIGVRISHWIAYHGIAININPNLEDFQKIVPCGLNPHEFGITSLSDLGISCDIAKLHDIIKKTCPF